MYSFLLFFPLQSNPKTFVPWDWVNVVFSGLCSGSVQASLEGNTKGMSTGNRGGLLSCSYTCSNAFRYAWLLTMWLTFPIGYVIWTGLSVTSTWRADRNSCTYSGADSFLILLSCQFMSLHPLGQLCFSATLTGNLHCQNLASFVGRQGNRIR